MADFFVRGAYHRAKKIWKGPAKNKKNTRVTVGMDGIRRKRKKKKTALDVGWWDDE